MRDIHTDMRGFGHDWPAVPETATTEVRRPGLVATRASGALPMHGPDIELMPRNVTGTYPFPRTCAVHVSEARYRRGAAGILAPVLLTFAASGCGAGGGDDHGDSGLRDFVDGRVGAQLGDRSVIG
jgi:hypothetical protein